MASSNALNIPLVEDDDVMGLSEGLKGLPLQSSFLRGQTALNSWHIGVQQVTYSFQISLDTYQIGLSGLVLAFSSRASAHLAPY